MSHHLQIGLPPTFLKSIIKSLIKEEKKTNKPELLLLSIFPNFQPALVMPRNIHLSPALLCSWSRSSGVDGTDLQDPFLRLLDVRSWLEPYWTRQLTPHSQSLTVLWYVNSSITELYMCSWKIPEGRLSFSNVPEVLGVHTWLEAAHIYDLWCLFQGLVFNLVHLSFSLLNMLLLKSLHIFQWLKS